MRVFTLHVVGLLLVLLVAWHAIPSNYGENLGNFQLEI